MTKDTFQRMPTPKKQTHMRYTYNILVMYTVHVLATQRVLVLKKELINIPIFQEVLKSGKLFYRFLFLNY